MKVFNNEFKKSLRERYKCKSKYVTPWIVNLALEARFSHERKKIEEWVLSIPESEKPDTIARLQSERSQQHFGAYYELVTGEFFKKLGYSVEMHPSFGSEKPDLLISGKGLEKPIVVEVATVFDDPEWEGEERKFNDILEQLDIVKHHFLLNIQCESTPIPEDIDYDSLRQFIIQWFDSFNPKTTENIQETSYDQGGLKLSLMLMPKKRRFRKKREPIIGSYGLPARFISSQQLRNALRKKATKYNFVKKQGYPYLVAASLYNTFLNNHSVVDQLLGKHALTISRNAEGHPVNHQWGRDSSGICRHNQNTRLSGIITITSEWATYYPDILQGLYKSLNNVLRCLLLKIFGKPTEVHRFSLIRNPHARVQLEDDLMKGYPQFTKTVENSTLTTYSWIDEESCVPFDC